MKAINIDWDITIDEAIGAIDDLTSEEAASFLGVDKETYEKWTLNKRHDYAAEAIKRNAVDIEELFNLPSSVELPQEFVEEDINAGYVTDWLSDEYGFFINGYYVEKDNGEII